MTRLTMRSLARVDQHGLQLHRLTQAILRDCHTPAQAAATRACAEAILAASNPGDPERSRHLAPVGAANAARDGRRPCRRGQPALRKLACDACGYLIARRDIRTCHDCPTSCVSSGVSGSATTMSMCWRLHTTSPGRSGLMGRYVEARELARDILDRSAAFSVMTIPRLCAPRITWSRPARRGRGAGCPRPGPGHPGPPPPAPGRGPPRHLVLRSKPGRQLHDVGEVQAARDLAQDTLDRRRRLLGEDHLDTLPSAKGLAAKLRELGEVQAARDLDQDTLDRRRRVLGEDHPSTLSSAHNLAADLRELGEVQAARDLDQDTLDRRRRVLGEDHPDTLATATSLARDLRALSEPDDEL